MKIINIKKQKLFHYIKITLQNFEVMVQKNTKNKIKETEDFGNSLFFLIKNCFWCFFDKIFSYYSLNNQPIKPLKF